MELRSIARGVVVADRLLKRAPVRLVRADPVTPGKLALLFAGGVAEVEEALEEALQAAALQRLDELWLPQAHPALVPALDGRVQPLRGDDALGVLELATVCSTLLAADAALKAAQVALVGLHLARGVGGKGYVLLGGEQHDVETALQAGFAAVPPERQVACELVARPHAELSFVLRRLQGGL